MYCTSSAWASDRFLHPCVLHSSRGFAQVCSARVSPSIIPRLESGVPWWRAWVMSQGDKDLWQMTARRGSIGCCSAAVRQPWRSLSSRLVWDEMWVSRLSCLRPVEEQRRWPQVSSTIELFSASSTDDCSVLITTEAAKYKGWEEKPHDLAAAVQQRSGQHCTDKLIQIVLCSCFLKIAFVIGTH